MAISTKITWEVRTATGSDNNGGGFNPSATGTDYSQQTSPQWALTGIASAGAGNTILYASAAATMVGNVAQAISGTNVNPGYYEILSVSVGVSITFSTNNSGGSICSGVAVSGVINIGGALATLTNAITQSTQNNIIYCVGSQTITSAITLSLSYSGSGAANFQAYSIIGYSSSRGDNGRFTITTSTNSIDIIRYASGAGQVNLFNLLLQSTAGSPGNGIEAGTSGGSSDLALFNCRITGCLNGIYAPYSGSYFIVPISLNNCQIDNCTTSGIYTISTIFILNSLIYNCSYGLVSDTTPNQSAGGFICIGSVFYNHTTACIFHKTTSSSNNNSNPAVILNCALLNSGTGYEFDSNNAVTLHIINTIIDSNGTGYLAAGGGGMVMCGTQLNNAVRNNTTLRTNFPTGVGEITLTADPFTNRSGLDFTLNATAGGGAACKAAGYQSTLL